MKTRITLILMITMAFLLLSSCGPTPEEIATQTASAWTSTPVSTSTPTSTPTPTPIPYDLSLNVVDAEGNQINEAQIVFPESGDDEPVDTDETGSVSWTNLQGENASIEVNAQGYFEQMESLVLVRGQNEVSLTMERDPLQLLPSEACQANEKVIYIEDFEDGVGQRIEGIGRPTWEYKTDSDHGTYLYGEEQSQTRLMFDATEYYNYVVHFDVLRPTDAEIMWFRVREECCPISYIGVMSKDGNTWLQREGPNEPFWGSRFISRPDGETWEHISLSVFNGNFDFWIDNDLLLGVTDPDPIGPGMVSIDIVDHIEPFAIDNFVVSELSEDYEPPAIEEGATQ